MSCTQCWTVNTYLGATTDPPHQWSAGTLTVAMNRSHERVLPFGRGDSTDNRLIGDGAFRRRRGNPKRSGEHHQIGRSNQVFGQTFSFFAGTHSVPIKVPSLDTETTAPAAPLSRLGR